MLSSISDCPLKIALSLSLSLSFLSLSLSSPEHKSQIQMLSLVGELGWNKTSPRLRAFSRGFAWGALTVSQGFALVALLVLPLVGLRRFLLERGGARGGRELVHT